MLSLLYRMPSCAKSRGVVRAYQFNSCTCEGIYDQFGGREIARRGGETREATAGACTLLAHTPTKGARIAGTHLQRCRLLLQVAALSCVHGYSDHKGARA